MFGDEDVGKPLCGLFGIGSGESHPAGWISSKDGAVPAVRIAQMHDPMHAEHIAAGPKLSDSVDRRPDNGLVAYHSVCGADDDNTMALGSQPGERSAGEDNFIIRMGMECHDSDHGAA